MTANLPALHIRDSFVDQQARIIAMFGNVFAAAESLQEGQAIAARVTAMAALGPDAGLRPFAA
ncbi:hypothetical protein [Roseicyclus sp.]|uniref:hypothetical protein n=1 Tax=Roseicyclus sp. TaxID=1914329 RepID=UPI003F6C7F38